MINNKKVTDKQLINNLLLMEIDFGNYPELKKEYEAFKKLSGKEQIIAFRKKPSALRSLALSVYSIEE